MPVYVHADEFRDILGIPITPFVLLEKRPTTTLDPAAREALKDAKQLKSRNEALYKEWQARCQLIDTKLPHNNRTTGIDDRLRDAKSDWKYTTSEYDMLRLDVARYDISGLRLDPERRAKANKTLTPYLDGFLAADRDGTFEVSLAVTKGDGKFTVKFYRTKDGTVDEVRSAGKGCSSVKHGEVVGTHVFPGVDEAGRKKYDRSAFPKAGSSGASYGYMVSMFFVELYFFATGKLENEIKKVQHGKSPKAKVGDGTLDGQNTPVISPETLENIWSSFDTQRDRTWIRAGPLKLKKAWAHMFNRPLEGAPDWDDFKRIAGDWDSSLKSVTYTAAWEMYGNIPSTHTQVEHVSRGGAAQAGNGNMYGKQASAPNVPLTTTSPANRTYSALQLKTENVVQEVSDDWYFPSFEILESLKNDPEFLECQRSFASMHYYF